MIVDLSRVLIVDTQVALRLVQVAQALRLALTSVSPMVAATLAGLVVTRDELLIARSPDEILAQL